MGGNASTRPLNDDDRASLYRAGIILGAGAVVVTSDPPGAGGDGRDAESYERRVAGDPSASHGFSSGGSHPTPPGGGGMSSSAPSNPPGAGEGRARELGAHLDLDAMNRGRAARGMPTLTRAQLEERLESLPAPSDAAAVASYPGEGRKLDCPFIECAGCDQPFPAGDALQLRVKGKLFAFHPGQFCPDCAARYDRDELELPREQL